MWKDHRSGLRRRSGSWQGEKLRQGRRVGILCAGETEATYREGKVVVLGSRSGEEEIARHLYEALRSFDAEGTEYIYSEAFDTPRMGQAIMNRLLKAAGHRVLQVR